MSKDTPMSKVGIIMGSQSDLRVMSRAVKVLDRFNIPNEVRIVSAHRTPQNMFQYAREAASRGLEVIIAGAGGAAHLPGMVASITWLPVIGVPIHATALGGLDALLSIVQMPRGVPVATVAIDNAENAAYLSVRLLSLRDLSLRKQYEDFIQKQAQNVPKSTLSLDDLERTLKDGSTFSSL